MVRELDRLELEKVGQIEKGQVTFGDLTVFVGPQASGKSIFLQFVKLVLETGYIHDQLPKHGVDWGSDTGQFLDVYLGQGMRRVWNETKSSLSCNAARITLATLAASRKRNRLP